MQPNKVFCLIFALISSSLSKNICSKSVTDICECQAPATIRCLQKHLFKYPDFDVPQKLIQNLDVSNNQLTTFPLHLIYFNRLEVLNLSYNRIESIRSTVFPKNLAHLILAYNNISNWLDINPTKIFQSAIGLHTLDLSGNPIRIINGMEDDSILKSTSLRVLKLNDCQLTEIRGSAWLSGMIGLEHLSIRSNPITTLPDLEADRLTHLDVGDCKLKTLRRTAFARMPMLTNMNLSSNHHLTLSYDGGYLESKSIRWIDMSRCYMETIELRGLPNVTTVLLNVNSLTQLTRNTFEHNDKIDRLDLSSNAITHIESNTFDGMRRLTMLDLSFNLIREIDANTFRSNQQLKIINLSRNTIERFHRVASNSLQTLNLSSCETLTIDDDALNEMPQLIELDLSKNLLNEFPSTLKSSSLQILDLSQCRLSKIENDTFSHFDELSHLNLAGNRLTSTFRCEYFANNVYLNEVWIADNPWHCECNDKSFKEFYHFLRKNELVKDRSQLRCFSPTNAYGKTWDAACYNNWYATDQTQSHIMSRIWTITMVILVNVTVLYFGFSGFKRWISYRREMEEEQRRRTNLETTRELIRHNQMVLDQEGQLNAPDPRETHPPCYEDAIRLPRLIRSTISLKRVDLVSHSIHSRTRSRSEENVGARSAFAIKNASQPLQHFCKSKASERNGCYKVKNRNGISSQSVIEVIDQLETDNGNSPYAKRKLDGDIEIPSTSRIPYYDTDESNKIIIRDNHYRSESHLSVCSYSTFTSTSDSSIDSKEFFKLSQDFSEQESND